MKTQPNRKLGKWTTIPILRGVVSFVMSLYEGTKILMYSADVLEANWPEDEEAMAEDKLDKWMKKTFGEKGAWNIMIYLSVIIALVMTIGMFILLPTVIANWLKAFIQSDLSSIW